MVREDRVRKFIQKSGQQCVEIWTICREVKINKIRAFAKSRMTNRGDCLVLNLRTDMEWIGMDVLKNPWLGRSGRDFGEEFGALLALARAFAKRKVTKIP